MRQLKFSDGIFHCSCGKWFWARDIDDAKIEFAGHHCFDGAS